ncbi:flagellar assembly protein FliH [Pleionea sediminis]|uniref:flagellar assembly protein FliH n=1 Tax=Pleionea sediminis TaxID=2569479 RepID=UPI001185EE30|nr:flagellar assembly protein FliH [Pleionea sediminis]
MTHSGEKKRTTEAEKVQVMSDDDQRRSEPWELPSFDKKREVKKDVEEEEEQLSLPTAEEIEAIRQSAFDEGKEQGYKIGMQQAQQEIKIMKTEFSKIMELLEQPLAQEEESIVKELTELSMMMTRQIIRRELKLNPEQIIAVIRESLKLLPSSERKVMIHLHPEDANLIRKIFSVDNGNESHWILADDPSISRGGCFITTDVSKIDATLEKRVIEIFSHVFGEQRAHKDEPKDDV